MSVGQQGHSCVSWCFQGPGDEPGPDILSSFLDLKFLEAWACLTHHPAPPSLGLTEFLAPSRSQCLPLDCFTSISQEYYSCQTCFPLSVDFLPEFSTQSLEHRGCLCCHSASPSLPSTPSTSPGKPSSTQSPSLKGSPSPAPPFAFFYYFILHFLLW